MKNEKWYTQFDDADFTHYIESGEALAVHLVRDEAQDVDTRGKWIDVLAKEEFSRGSKQHFWIAAELFPRITNPQYTNDPQINKYRCWHAAHGDIDRHREKGHHGSKYLVVCLEKKKQTRNGRQEEYWQVAGSKTIQQKHLPHCRRLAEAMLDQKKK